jgi:hypothetical protein
MAASVSVTRSPRRASVGREGEASDGHRAAVLPRRVGHQPPPARGDAPEAPGAAIVERGRATDRGQRETIAIGVLEAEPVLARAPRGDRHRGGVHGGRERHRDGHQALARAPGAAHALDGAGAEELAVAVAEQRPARGLQEGGGHARQSRWAVGRAIPRPRGATMAKEPWSSWASC